LWLFVWHEESLSSSRIEVRDAKVIVSFTIHMEDLITLGPVDPDGSGVMDGKEFAAVLPAVETYLREHYRLFNGDEPLALENIVGGLPEGAYVPVIKGRFPLDVTLRFGSASPITRLRLQCDAFRDKATKVRHIVQFPDGRSVILENSRVEAEWPGPTWAEQLGQFLGMGIEHILTGWDHLAFLIALLVAARSIGSVLKFVTAFTVAHSLTLGLTALRVIGSSGWVEPVIAASIVFVAVENLFTRETRRRWLLVFGFGLIHGMGFAGALLEVQLEDPVPALLGFNVGVELGQLAVVCVVYPIFMALRRREQFYERGVVRVVSGTAACCGLFWLVQRLLRVG
jgi:hydrogenase/urease accessory protein HupE